MAYLQRVHITSVAYTGNQTFPKKLNRSYFFIVMTSDTVEDYRIDHYR